MKKFKTLLGAAMALTLTVGVYAGETCPVTGASADAKASSCSAATTEVVNVADKSACTMGATEVVNVADKSACASACSKSATEVVNVADKAACTKDASACTKDASACTKDATQIVDVADKKECAAACASSCTKGAAVMSVSAEGSSPFYTLDSTVSDFSLVHAQSGEMKALSDLAGSKATVVVFWNQNCPWVEGKNGAADSIEAFYNNYKDQGVNVVAIDAGVNNSRDSIMEYSSKRSFPILINSDSTVAAAFNAQYTPETFVLGSDMKVQYMGAFHTGSGDDVRTHTENAVKDILAGNTPTVREARGTGCSVKYADGAKPKADAAKPTT